MTIKVAYAGHDFFGTCLTMLLRREDVEVCVLATNDLADPRNRMIQDVSKDLQVPILVGQPDDDWVASLTDAEPDLLVCAAYYWRIPVEVLPLSYAVNIHPSLLPDGRGPNPMPYFIDEEPEAFGVTIHELTARLDRGPVLLQAGLQVTADDTVDSLYLKTLALAPQLLGRLIDDLPGAFARKIKQGPGSYLAEYPWEARTFDALTASIGDVMKLHRKFGLFGLVAVLSDGTRHEVVVRQALQCSTGLEVGAMSYWNGTRALLTLHDGLVLVSLSRHW